MNKLRTRGVSTVEFLVIFPVALLIVLCIIQFGFLYMGKLTLNHATFMAAREGAVRNANVDAIRSTVIRGLIPFYQNSTNTNNAQRIVAAYLEAQADANIPLVENLRVERLSPNADTFQDFGLTVDGQRQIPHDNLRWRSTEVRTTSGVNIQDANLLKIKVTYAYQLKVPLMATVARIVMCTGGGMPIHGMGTDVSVFNTVLSPVSNDCLRYYSRGRIPIQSFATIEMQSPPIL